MTRAHAPDVSVLLPVRNGAPLVAETLASLLSQTLHDIEIVVIDDGSTDDTPRVLDAITDDRLVRLRHPRSRGIAAALKPRGGCARAPRPSP